MTGNGVGTGYSVLQYILLGLAGTGVGTAQGCPGGMVEVEQVQSWEYQGGQHLGCLGGAPNARQMSLESEACSTEDHFGGGSWVLSWSCCSLSTLVA